jgi:hypothetical protein
MFQLPLCRDLLLKLDATTAAETQGADCTLIPAATLATLTLENAQGVLLTLEPNWSQAVFNHDFPTWLLNLIRRINDFIAQFLAEVEGPGSQAELEALLASRLSYDPVSKQVVIK